MSKIFLVGQPEFTSLSTPTMYNYSFFKIKETILGILRPKQIFTMWLQEVISPCHKWRVPQNIQRALPPTCHIELGLDHTKIWYVDGQAAEPTDLPFYPTVDEIFNELPRQSNTIYPIPHEAREKQTNLLIPLTDGENADQYEVELQMQPFVPKAQQTATSTTKKKLVNKEDDTSGESTEEDIDVLLKGITEIDFDHP